MFSYSGNSFLQKAQINYLFLKKKKSSKDWLTELKMCSKHRILSSYLQESFGTDIAKLITGLGLDYMTIPILNQNQNPGGLDPLQFV